MGNRIQLQINKPIQEIDIAGIILNLDYSDDNLDRYQKEIENISKKYDVENVADMKTTKEYLCETVDMIFQQEGLGQQIYDKTGKSSTVLLSVTNQIVEIIENKITESATRSKKLTSKYADKIRG